MILDYVWKGYDTLKKKIAALLICLILALSVCTSCGGNKKNDTETSTEETQKSGWFKDAFKVHDDLGY